MAKLNNLLVKAITPQQSFITMLRCLKENRAPSGVTLESILIDFGFHVYNYFPELEVNELIKDIQYRLLVNNLVYYGLKVNESFISAKIKSFDFKTINFNLLKGVSCMAIKKNSEPVVSADVKEETDNVPMAKTAKTAKIKKAKEPKEPKGQGATGYVCDLLMERKYTDEELLEKVIAKYPDRTEKQVKVYLSVQRSEINSGRKTSHVLKADEKGLERLVSHDGKIVPYSQVPKKPASKKERKLLASLTGIDPVTKNKKDVSEEVEPVKATKKKIVTK